MINTDKATPNSKDSNFRQIFNIEPIDSKYYSKYCFEMWNVQITGENLDTNTIVKAATDLVLDLFKELKYKKGEEIKKQYQNDNSCFVNAS